MDNASKALIIAGGILIAIMVITLAMYLFSTAREFVDASNRSLEIAEIESYNRFYLAFPSTITGAEALNIINKALSNNEQDSTLSIISIKFGDLLIDSTSDIPATLKDSKNYLANYKYYYKLSSITGILESITIQ